MHIHVIVFLLMFIVDIRVVRCCGIVVRFRLMQIHVGIGFPMLVDNSLNVRLRDLAVRCSLNRTLPDGWLLFGGE